MMNHTTTNAADADADVLAARATHPDLGTCSFVRVRQDRRTYYGLVCGAQTRGMLTDLRHARETVEYWRSRGWMNA